MIENHRVGNEVQSEGFNMGEIFHMAIILYQNSDQRNVQMALT